MCRTAELTEKLTSGKHCSDWKSTITASIGSTKLAHESGWKQHFTSYHLCLVPIKVLILWGFFFSKSFIFLILFLCVYLNLFLSLPCVFDDRYHAPICVLCIPLFIWETTVQTSRNWKHLLILEIKMKNILKLKLLKLLNEKLWSINQDLKAVPLQDWSLCTFLGFFSIGIRYFSCTKDMNINVMLSVTCI